MIETCPLCDKPYGEMSYCSHWFHLPPERWICRIQGCGQPIHRGSCLCERHQSSTAGAADGLDLAIIDLRNLL